MAQTSLKLEIDGKHYKTCGIIGEGGAGVVFLGKDKNQKSVAIKMIRNYNNPIVKESVDAEIMIQSSFAGSTKVIQFLGVRKEHNCVYIVLELGQYTLKNCIDMRRMNQYDLIFMLCDVLDGLNEIHNGKIIHRDIKPENIIYKEGTFKITDFGIAIDKEEDNSFVGTPLYLPPEIIFESDENYTKKVDIWSLGVATFQSYFRVSPFFHDKQFGSYKNTLQQVKANIKLLTPNFSMQKFLNVLAQKKMVKEVEFIKRRLKNTSEELLNIICQMLEPNPEKRDDAQFFLMMINSLKDQMGDRNIPKSRINKKYKKEDIPFEINVFCRAKDLFYELNSEVVYEEAKEAVFALELGTWYIQGKLYSGLHLIMLDQIEIIKDYMEPPETLWKDVRQRLRTYYFYLMTNDENQYFNKINELRLYILICGAWDRIVAGNNTDILCKAIEKITKLEINNLKDVFECFTLYSESSFHKIQNAILDEFYF